MKYYYILICDESQKFNQKKHTHSIRKQEKISFAIKSEWETQNWQIYSTAKKKKKSVMFEHLIAFRTFSLALSLSPSSSFLLSLRTSTYTLTFTNKIRILCVENIWPCHFSCFRINVFLFSFLFFSFDCGSHCVDVCVCISLFTN